MDNKITVKPPKDFSKLIESTCSNFDNRPFVWSKWHSPDFTPRSYNEMLIDIKSLASYLNSNGLYGKNIMLFSENSYYWLVINYAISAYCGVSVNANKDWQGYDIINAIDTVDIDLIIYSDKNKPVIDGIKAKLRSKKIDCLNIEEVPDLIEEYKSKISKKELSKKAIPADQISQIIFTTGSSGLPKAVPLNFNNTEVCLKMMLSRLPFNSSDRQFLFLPLYHIFGNMAALVSFRQGHKLYICSDSSKIKEEVKIAQPTILCGVPLFFNRIYQALGQKTIDKINRIAKITNPLAKIGLNLRKILFKKLYAFFGGKLKYVICGAAPLDYNVKKLFMNIGLDFVEAYGMSETAAFITMEKTGQQRANSVGSAYDDVKCKLVNISEFGQGEVVVKGPNVFTGYYKGRAIEKSARDEEGYFHTGDMGHFDDKGRLFLTGRKKRLILTSNGENVSPDELEKLFKDKLKVEKVKVYAMENIIAINVYAGPKEKRTDNDLRTIIHKTNQDLPKFKQVRNIFINRAEIESVK